MFDIPCVIFAGGKSSRMGEDKSLLPFGDFNTLTQYQYSRLSKIFPKVYISCKDKSKFDFHADFIEDINSNDIFSPTIAFLSIFQTLDSFFAISVDTPFVEEKQIKKILDQHSIYADAIVAQTPSGVQPLCGVYYKSINKQFAYMLNNNEHKLQNMLRNAKTIFVELEDDKVFLNLNYPHEYQEALKLI